MSSSSTLPPRTLQDYFRALVNRPDVYARRVVVASPVENHTVRCACGALAAADMCLDVRALDLEQRVTFGLTSEDFICDGCVGRRSRTHAELFAELFAAIAPADEAPPSVLPPMASPPPPPLPAPLSPLALP